MAFSIISRPSTYGDPGSSGMSGPTGPLDPEAALAKKKIFGATEGRAQELKNDPYQKSVMEFLQGQVSGKNVPYSDTVKNSILAQQGRGSADAEAAQMQSLRDSLGATGGSIYDPGYQAAQRQAMSQRQGANLDAQGQLNATAGLENFKAQSQGANQLSAARNAQNAQVNQMNLAGADYRAQTQVAKPAAGPVQPRRINDPLAHLGGPSSMTHQNQAAMRL